MAGLVTAALIIPVFLFRHYIQDGGKCRRDIEDLQMGDGSMVVEKKAGFLPYLTLIAGVVVLLTANWFFQP